MLPLINNGDGTFHEGYSIPLPGDLAVIVQDFATLLWSLNTYLGDGLGGFGQKQSVQVGASYDLHAADINGDGKLDLVNVSGSVGLIWWGRGDGTFSAPTYLKPPTTYPVDSAAVADFNNDGRLDVALLSGKPCHPYCGSSSANTVWMYKNNGGTSFTLTTHAPSPLTPETSSSAMSTAISIRTWCTTAPMPMDSSHALREFLGFGVCLGAGQ